MSVLLLGACSGSGQPERPRAFAEFSATNELTVRASGPGAFLGAELNAPDGRVFAGEAVSEEELERRAAQRTADAPGRYPYGVGVGASGGSSSGIHPQIGISLPVRNPFAQPAPPRTFGMARIRLPDGTATRPDWQDWRIIVRFANDGRTAAELRQPPPPPPQP